jgi:hypothetical protein
VFLPESKHSLNLQISKFAHLAHLFLSRTAVESVIR